MRFQDLEPAVAAHLAAEEPPPAGIATDIAVERAHVHRQLARHFAAFALPGPEVASVVDQLVPVPAARHRDGTEIAAGSVTVRCYRPPGTDGEALPVHLLLHGGGWSTGSIDDAVSDASARHRATAARCLVLAPEYRLAPEHPYPAAVHDVLAVLDWLPTAVDLGADTRRVVLGGSSAGANLAAAAALSGPRRREVVGLLLEVPALDLTGATMLATAERLRLPAGLELDEAGMEHLMARYFGGRQRWLALRDEPTASPLLATDLSGLPPVVVQVGGLDPLRQDGIRFAERVAAAGGRSWCRSYAGALHGSPILNSSWPTARRWHDDALRLLADLFDGAALPGAGDGPGGIVRSGPASGDPIAGDDGMAPAATYDS